MDASKKAGNLPSPNAVNLGLAIGVGCWCLIVASCAPLVSKTPLNIKNEQLTASLFGTPLLPQDRMGLSARREGALSGDAYEPDFTLPSASRELIDEGPYRTEFILDNDQANVRNFFDVMDVKIEEIRQTRIVPAIYFDALPWDLKPMRDIQGRKDIYFSILLPLILDVNRDIMKERAVLMNSNNRGAIRSISNPEIKAIAKKYYELDGSVQSLLKKVAPIPVDMVLAQSIEESGWGTSRFALKGHALFGQRVFNDKAHGFIPKDREEGLEFKVQGFASLRESIATYALNLNRHRAYTQMRERRQQYIANDWALSGTDLMPLLQAYSTERGKYIAKIIQLIEDNNLSDFNYTALETHRDLSVVFTESSADKLAQVAALR